jgi:hypothetical protein
MDANPVMVRLWERHHQLISRLNLRILGERKLEEYRFQEVQVIAPIYGHTWEFFGGLSFRYKNPFNIEMAFDVEHWSGDQFIIFICLVDPPHCFGYRSTNLAGIPACLLQLSEENWTRETDAYARKRY